MSESKYQAGCDNLGQNPLTFMIPICSTTVLYDILDMVSQETLLQISLSPFTPFLRGNIVTILALELLSDKLATSAFRFKYSVCSKF